MDSTPFNAPRPTPTFYIETSFSTKRERSQTPREKPPPLRPVSRKSLFAFHSSSIKKESRASIISINPQQKSLNTPFYHPNIRDLYFDQVFDNISHIGSGSFGEVYKVRCKCDNQFYAVKKSKQKFKGSVDRLNTIKEANRYEQLPYHRNCVKYIKAWEERDQLYIQTELCKMSLSDYAEEHHNIPDRQIWNYLIDLLMAVKHLHDHNLIHLDIKPDNVFVNDDDVCKLGDFGLVFDLNKGSTDSAVEGDAKYLAPELMQGNFGKPADIFSLGITILELACDLDLPKGDELWHQLRSKVLPEDLLKEKAEELQFCIRWMMEPDPEMRPTVDQLLNHPYVKETWQRRLQEQIELEKTPKTKTVPHCNKNTKTKHWASDAMHSIKEKSIREEEDDEEYKAVPVTPLNFSPPLFTHPFLEKETSFLTSPHNDNSNNNKFCTPPNGFDSPNLSRLNRSIFDQYHDHLSDNSNNRIKNKFNDSDNSNNNSINNSNNNSFISANSNFDSDDNDNNSNIKCIPLSLDRSQNSLNNDIKTKNLNLIYNNINNANTAISNKRTRSKNGRHKRNRKHALADGPAIKSNLFNDSPRHDSDDVSELEFV